MKAIFLPLLQGTIVICRCSCETPRWGGWRERAFCVFHLKRTGHMTLSMTMSFEQYLRGFFKVEAFPLPFLFFAIFTFTSSLFLSPGTHHFCLLHGALQKKPPDVALTLTFHNSTGKTNLLRVGRRRRASGTVVPKLEAERSLAGLSSTCEE